MSGDPARAGALATVAAQMFLSELTVQDHLKSIFDKTGLRKRRAVIVRAVGR